ncbi:hypothetical protein LL912_03710 [Niabella sp. CC-SYL272]|uniref:hypothetical protein n=1 Tax=Niabella agricola TaxID=2891571 RepID=UPI001F44342F|nr:hypothetical protein [Niabella agricola]MCF3107877.1 hypothetical protein [Niabella agricola]
MNCSQILEELNTFIAGGRIGIYFRQSNAYRYEMQDHLGNVRAVLVKTNSGSTDYVVFRDYYPFGMEIGGEVIPMRMDAAMDTRGSTRKKIRKRVGMPLN